jgi:hypothetical protein
LRKVIKRTFDESKWKEIANRDEACPLTMDAQKGMSLPPRQKLPCRYGPWFAALYDVAPTNGKASTVKVAERD